MRKFSRRCLSRHERRWLLGCWIFEREDGQAHREAAAFANLALYTDPAAMKLGQVLDDREAQARPFATLPVTSIETIEDFREVVRADANAAISNVYCHPFVLDAQGNSYSACGRRVTNSVVYQIREDLMQSLRIA